MEKLLRTWKKAYQEDVVHLGHELRELLSFPSVIFIEGPMGVGKTFFVRSFVGKKFLVQSPSFPILQEYGTILHGDFYRIEKKEDLWDLEIPFVLEGKKMAIFEWGWQYRFSLRSLIPEEYSYFLLKIQEDASSSLFRHYNFYSVDFSV